MDCCQSLIDQVGQSEGAARPDDGGLPGGGDLAEVVPVGQHGGGGGGGVFRPSQTAGRGR